MSAHGPEDDELRACLQTLKAIDADRGLLTRLTQEERRELLVLAGRITKPRRAELRKMAKAFRRAERQQAQHEDRAALEQAGLRIQRRSETYAPLWLPPPDANGADAETVARPDLNAAPQLLCVQAALYRGASLLRFDVPGVRRLQLCQA